MIEKTCSYHITGFPDIVIYYETETKRIHRFNGPAKIDYTSNGEINSEKWWFDGYPYTVRVNDWVLENNFKSWEVMSENDFVRMWLEIL